MLKRNGFRLLSNKIGCNFYLERTNKKYDQNCIIYEKSGMCIRQKSFSGQSNAPGHGAGKGGGAGGSVRESGGGLGEYGAAQEEHYFFNKQKEQLLELKKKLKKKVDDKQKEEK